MHFTARMDVNTTGVLCSRAGGHCFYNANSVLWNGRVDARPIPPMSSRVYRAL